MKRVMITVALVMMVSILFGVSASAAHTSKNVTHRMGKRSSLKSAHSGSKRKQLKKSKKIKKPKAAGSVKIEMEGKVIEQLPNAMFRVELQNGSIVTAHIAGKLRMNFIRIRFGDRVLVDMSPDQPDRGRIIWRYKQ